MEAPDQRNKKNTTFMTENTEGNKNLMNLSFFIYFDILKSLIGAII